MYKREGNLKEVCPDGMGDGLENDSKIYNIYSKYTKKLVQNRSSL